MQRRNICGTDSRNLALQNAHVLGSKLWRFNLMSYSNLRWSHIYAQHSRKFADMKIATRVCRNYFVYCRVYREAWWYKNKFKIFPTVHSASSQLGMGGLLLSEENDDTISFKSIYVFIHPINIANSYQKVITLA